MLATMLAILALAPPAPAALTVPYEVQGPAAFHEAVRVTLDDPRGWSLGGAVQFRPVPDGGRFVVRLVAPETVAAHPPCSAWYSCRSGENVLINSMRWTDGADSYAGALDEYRRHVVNHEVGHALGLGHSTCSAAGRPAAVMQQQSKGLEGCTANAWPVAAERRALAQLLGVRARAPRLGPPPRLSAFARP